jgi:hypothetical protein
MAIRTVTPESNARGNETMIHSRIAKECRAPYTNRSRNVRRLHCELLETRYLLSAVAFKSHEIISNWGASDPQSPTAADLDGDGDMDILTAFQGGGSIAWFANLDGRGNFGPARVITTNFSDVPHAADLDGDGDKDVLSASVGTNGRVQIVWYENTDGKGTFGAQKVITTQQIPPQSILVADLDGDGDYDVLSTALNPDEIAWYENTDGQGSFATKQVFAKGDLVNEVYAVDLDGDGDLDVLSDYGQKDWIAWRENTDGQGTFGPPKMVDSDSAKHKPYFTAADVDNDGDIDVLGGWGSGFRCWENIDGHGNFVRKQEFSFTIAWGLKELIPADMDGDGDIDLLSRWFDTPGDAGIVWYENTDGQGNFALEHTIVLTGSHVQLGVADIDSDGDIDVLSAPRGEDTIVWYENTDTEGNFAPQKDIVSPGISAKGAASVYAADLDGDGDMDALSASVNDDKIAWYENTDGKGTFGAQKVITTEADVAVSVHAADLDNDGDFDVLSASSRDGKIAWYENTDGRGTFGSQRVITTDSGFYYMKVLAADVDGDGDIDVLSSSGSYDTNYRIAWYENTDSRGTFGTQRIITTEILDPRGWHVADLDMDGDVDVLSASSDDDKIAWYENTDGRGSFGRQQIIARLERAHSVSAADVDGDGDMDVLSGAFWSEFSWQENTDGQGTFGPQHVIQPAMLGVFYAAVYAADVDADGDLDIFTAGSNITWYENTDGNGTFRPYVITDKFGGVADTSLYAADVDGDGDVDVLSASRGSDTIAWHENLGPAIQGDANLDGRVDAQDLNAVGTNWRGTDKTWEQGDFTGDGVVNSEDLNQLALNWQHGVPAPVSTSARIDPASGVLGHEQVPRAPLSASTQPTAAPAQFEASSPDVLSPPATARSGKSQSEKSTQPLAFPCVSRLVTTSTTRAAGPFAERGFAPRAVRAHDLIFKQLAVAEFDHQLQCPFL